MKSNLKKIISTVSLIFVLLIALFAFNVFSSKTQTEEPLQPLNTDDIGEISYFGFSYAKNAEQKFEFVIDDLGDWLYLKVDAQLDTDAENMNYEDEFIVEKDLLLKITELLEKYNIYTWHGYKVYSNEYSEENAGFSLNIDFSDGQNLSAMGIVEFPQDYNEFYEELYNLIITSTKDKNEDVEIKENVDYSLYINLISDKKEEYGEFTAFIEHENVNKENVYSAYGLILSKLVDFDNNGVLELILIAAKKGEMDLSQWHSFEDGIVEIYTITKDNELKLVGKTSLVVGKFSDVSISSYILEYTFINDMGYIISGKDLSEELIQYYAVNQDSLVEEIYLEKIVITGDGGQIYYIDEKETNEEEFTNIEKLFSVNKESVCISGFSELYIDELNEFNEQTMEFLLQYK